MSSNTFNPLGPTFARTVTAASTTVVPTLTTPPAAIAPLMVALDYQFVNFGTQAVYLAYTFLGTTAPTAAIPADGTSGVTLGLMILPNTTRTLELPYGTQIACIAAAGGSSLYATIGSGSNT